MSAAPPSGAIEDGVHRLPVRVYYEDTDAGGIVYHARYLQFCERARSEMLRCLGIDHAAAWRNDDAGARVGFAVRRAELDYLLPAVLDDALVVDTEVEAVAAAYVDVAQCIRRGKQRLVEARLRVALVDGTGRPRRFPAEWRETMRSLVRPRSEGTGV